MCLPHFRFLLALILTALSAGCASRQDRLLLCGLDEVSLVRRADLATGRPEKLWQWRARDRADLPEDMRKAFVTTDDCKPVRNGSAVLISASSGGCALVSFPSGAVLWHARVPNAHSLELLPRERVVVAGSVSAKGNRLALFDLAQPAVPLWETPLRSAHGVVWDHARQRLWALGYDELRCYAPADWDSPAPSLTLVASHPLPDTDGHDLQPVPGSPDLILSTHSRVLLFNRDTAAFRPHPTLGNEPDVKALSPHPETGRLLWIPAQKPNWWSDTIRFEDTPAETRLPGARLYKARWFVAP